MTTQVEPSDKAVAHSLAFIQALLVKPDRGDSHLPLTRTDWYA